MNPGVGYIVNEYPVPSEAFITEQVGRVIRFRPTLYVRRCHGAGFGFDVRSIEDQALGAIRRRLFAVFPGVWAWGGRSAFDGVKLLHAHFGPNGVYALPIAGQLRVPLVVTFHGYDATTDMDYLSRNGGTNGARYVSKLNDLKKTGALFVAVSEYIRSALLDLGFPAGRVIRHYIGVDTEKFLPRSSNPQLRTIVCVARLVRAKGQYELLQAFYGIHMLHPDTRLVLVGEGPEKDGLQRKAIELGIRDRVDFLGSLQHQDVARIVGEATVGVLASKASSAGAREAFGIFSIEAASCGVPVIVSNSGGLPETLIPGKTGLLVDEGDVSSLTQALLEVLGSPEYAKALGAEGRRMALEKFDLGKQTAQLEMIYDEVLESAELA